MQCTTHTWQRLFEQHSAALVLYARQWVGSLGDAEDVVQEAFVRMIRGRAQPDDPAAYLFTAVRHAAVDRQRSDARRRRRERAVVERRPLFETDSPAHDEREAIELALRALPELQREVVVMKIWGALTFETIAEILRVSPNTAASRYRYAIKALRTHLRVETETEVWT